MRSYLTYKLKRLSIPVLAISLALGARFLLDPILHNRMPYGLFIIAVILTARLADTWETMVALILGFLLAGWFFVEPRSSLFISGPSAWLSAACYLFIGLSIVWIARNGHAAHVRPYLCRARQWVRHANVAQPFIRSVAVLEPARSCSA